MARMRALPTWVGLLGIGVAGLLLMGDAGNAEARRHKRRERRTDECKAPPVVSPADQEKAMRFYDSAVIYWESKEWNRARSDFQNAYNISKLPDFLINLALVSEKQRKFNDSIGYLEGYIDNCPNAPDLDKARQKIEDLRIAQAIEEGKNPPRTVKASLPPWPAIALMASGAGLLIAGVGLGGGAISKSHLISDPDNRTKLWSVDLQDIETAGQRMQTAAFTLDAIGVAALTAGVIWTGVYYAQGNTGLSLALAPRSGGGSAFILGRF